MFKIHKVYRVYKDFKVIKVYKVYKEYREAGVRLWLDETPRGAEFLKAHNQRLRDEAEQDLVNQMRLQNDREMAAAYRQYIETSEPEAAGSDQERLAQEVGNFTRAIGVG